MFKSIVVAVDPEQPSSSEKALPAAASLAKLHGARLTVASVVPDIRAMIKAEWSLIAVRELMETAQLKVASLLDRYPDAHGAKVEVLCGNIWRTIIRIAERAEADLIVLASHRPEMKDYLIGANAASVARHARCSVLVVRS